MGDNYEKIWQLTTPYLKQGVMKDFVFHTQNVVKAMGMLLEGEGGDERILMPAAILHDVGFSKVDVMLQTTTMENKREGQRQHLIFCKDIIQEILGKVGYNQKDIDRIIGIVEVHQFHKPEEKEKQMLIDADNLSDVMPGAMQADAISYKNTPENVFEIRTKNTYYSKTAQEIFKREMIERKKELNI